MQARSSVPPHPKDPSLWPREHGAYVQLLAPMLASLLFVRPSAAALAWACMAGTLFLLHEPVLVLLGRRGQRAKATLGGPAKRRVVGLLGIAAGAFATGVWLAPTVAPWLALPLLLSLLCASLLFQKRERTTPGQLVITAALTSFALPPMLASGVSTSRALAFVAAFASIQALSALTARGAIYRKQDGGRLLRWAMACSLLALVAFSVLSHWSLWPFSWSFAPWPFALITAMLLAKLFTPRSPKPVGWALAGASAVSLLLFGLGLIAA